MWGGGFKSLAGGPSACCRGVACFLVPFCRVGRGWPTLIHGPGLRPLHDIAEFGAKLFFERSFRIRGNPYLLALSCQAGVDSVNTYVCFISCSKTLDVVLLMSECRRPGISAGTFIDCRLIVSEDGVLSSWQ